MIGHLRHPGRCLLPFALAAAAYACGDDDESTAGRSDGGHAGHGGSDASSDSGRSGTSDGGGGRDGGMDVTEAQCRQTVNTSTQGLLATACSACLCEHEPNATAACDATCWELIACFATECPGLTPTSDEGSMCSVRHCMPFLGRAMAARAVEVVEESECMAACAADAADGGTEDGGP